MIEARNISYTVNGRDILKDISFGAEAGSFVAIIGPNGAGKTTLLRIIANALSATSGEVTLLGRPLHDWRPKELACARAVLSQRVEVAAGFPVSEVVMMGRYPHFDTHPSEADRRIVTRAMEAAGVAQLAQRPIQTLSGGEQQRVHLARAIAQTSSENESTPRLLLLDEPVSNLDPQYQYGILDKARSLTERGFCVVAVLHEIGLAASYADHIIALREGRKVFDGDVREMAGGNLLQSLFGLPMRLVESEGEYALSRIKHHESSGVAAPVHQEELV
jgi:iron complex transport system ATP-binding protein